MASDYQGETIQIFVFLRGKFLGYQCFGQDRITVGGTPAMDLPLPDCPETEGFWDVYISRGALYAWLRSPAGGNGKEGHEDPRKVQPLDSLSLGEYRLQAKLLVGEGLVQDSSEAEEDPTEDEAAQAIEEDLSEEEATPEPEEDPVDLEAAPAPEEVSAEEEVAEAPEEDLSEEVVTAASEEESTEEDVALAPEEDLTEEVATAAPEEESTEEDVAPVPEQDGAENEAALAPEEESAREEPSAIAEEQGEEEPPAEASMESDQEAGPAWQMPDDSVDEVEGISLDYARSIWKEEAEEESAEEAEAQPDTEKTDALTAQPDEDFAPAEPMDRDEPVPTLALEPEDQPVDEEEESSLEAAEEALDDPSPEVDPDYAELWGLSEEMDSVPQGDERKEDETEEATVKEEVEEWIGFGLEEKEDEPLSGGEPQDLVVETVSDEEPITLAEEETPSGEAPLGQAVETLSEKDPPSVEETVSDEEPLAKEEDLPADEPIILAEEEDLPADEPVLGTEPQAPAVESLSEEEPLTLAEEEVPQEEAASMSQEVSPPAESIDEEAEELEELIPLEKEPEEETVPSPLASDSDGLVEGMSQEERTKFWDDMAQEARVDQDGSEEEDVSDATPAEVSAPEEVPVEAVAEASPPEEEVVLEEEAPSTEEEMELEQDSAPASEPKSAGERVDSANTAVAIDRTEAEEEEDWEDDYDYEDEEEDEYAQDITYFSLVKEVFPDRAQPLKAHRGDHRALEVVRFRGSDVQDVGYLESGGAYTIRKGWSRSLWKRQGGVPPNFKLVRLKNGGLAELHIQDSVKGRLYSEDGSQDIWDLRGGKRGRFGLKGKASWLPLPADTWAVLRVNSGRYMVRYVTPRPKPVVQPIRPRVSMGQFKLVSLSMLSHILLIMVIGLVVPDTTLEGYNRTDQFARIDPDALKTLKPPPPPKKLDKPKPKAKKKAPKPKPKPQVASKHRIPKSAKKSPVPTKGKASGGGKKQVDVAQTGLLAALGSPDAGVLDAKGNSEILLAAVTNLDAVAVPSDTTTFNLAGVAGKLATSEIQVPTSDVIETVGAAQLIKNGDGTLGAMASKGSGEVRAVVHEPPKAKISIRGGMSREAVLKVVNAHLDEVRDCYERELLHNPGISGKILMEWLIQLDGSVRYAKTKFTNIGHSSDLHTCLQAQVVTWNFPRPKGGQEVLVTFPFLFESMGF